MPACQQAKLNSEILPFLTPFVRNGPILGGEVILTDFHFGFELPPAETFAGFELEFHVEANSKPSTNIHALIGRNGVGKTTLLNSMVKVIADSSEIVASFYTDNPLFGRKKSKMPFLVVWSRLHLAPLIHSICQLKTATRDVLHVKSHNLLGGIKPK